MKKNVLIFCSLPVVAAGMESLVKSSARFQLAGTVGSVDIARQYLSRHDIPLMVVDPNEAELAETRDVHEAFPGVTTAIVALVSHYVEQRQLQSYDGIIELRDSPRQIEETLVQTLSTLSEGHRESMPIYELSDREREVLTCVARGMQNKEIADHLFISVHTVMSHRKNIIAKTGIKSVAGLTVYALMNGWIEEGDIL